MLNSLEGPKTARWWHIEGAKIRCDLCPHGCLIAEGKQGLCRTRDVKGGVMRSLNYGKLCVSAVDPIEKKPMFHFHPASLLYSIGTFGCNMACKNCQNYVLASAGPGELPCEDIDVRGLLDRAMEKRVDGVAFTFNDPIVWLDFVLDASIETRRRGLFTMMNTNGYVNPTPLRDVLPYIDAMNIDVKGVTEEFYRSNCGAGLSEVLRTCEMVREKGIHLELTYLLIPGLNDSAEEIRKFSSWVRESMGADTPVHFFRFLPFHKLSHLQPQTIDKLSMAHRIAEEEGLSYVYYAGVVNDSHQNTYCPSCGAVVVERSSEAVEQPIHVKGVEVSRFCPTYSQTRVLLNEGACPRCGERIPIVF